MTSVGVRELRQRASELLRRVEAGESFEVTDRGRPVAVLAPIHGNDPLARMRAAGEVLEAVDSLDQLPEPLLIATHLPLPSQVLERLRQDER